MLQEPGFDPRNLVNFNSAREGQRLDSFVEDVEGSPLSADDCWIKGSVKIRLPKEGVRYASEDDAPEFTVDSVYYRPIVDVVQAAYQQECVRSWHFIPHKLFWRKNNPLSPDSSRTSSPLPSTDYPSSPTPLHTPAPASAFPSPSQREGELPQPSVSHELLDSLPALSCSSPRDPLHSPLVPSAQTTAPSQSPPLTRFPSLASESSASTSTTSSSSAESGDSDEGICVYSKVWHGDAWIKEDAQMHA